MLFKGNPTRRKLSLGIKTKMPSPSASSSGQSSRESAKRRSASIRQAEEAGRNQRRLHLETHRPPNDICVERRTIATHANIEARNAQVLKKFHSDINSRNPFKPITDKGRRKSKKSSEGSICRKFFLKRQAEE